MTDCKTRFVSRTLLVLGLAIGAACARREPSQVTARPDPETAKRARPDPETAKRGSIEITARLIEVPEGAIIKRELYNYATVLKYQVLQVHRGKVDGETLYVGHYNPFKPRSEAADKQVPDIGGNLKAFRAGQVQRLALDGSIDDQYLGGIINKYFELKPNPIYWAVWTDLVKD
jgi:hypothetical protein